MAIFKERIKANGKECNHLEITLDYSLGGYNYWNGNTDGRGYYLYVTPVSVGKSEYNGHEYETVSQILGQGSKMLLKQVARKSKKAEQESIVLAQEKKDELINYVCNKYGITLSQLPPLNCTRQKSGAFHFCFVQGLGETPVFFVLGNGKIYSFNRGKYGGWEYS